MPTTHTREQGVYILVKLISPPHTHTSSQATKPTSHTSKQGVYILVKLAASRCVLPCEHPCARRKVKATKLCHTRTHSRTHVHTLTLTCA
jgi:hypothetical protein